MKVTITEQMLLLFIYRLDKEAYGFNIREMVCETTGKEIAFGTLYNNLDQLLKKGYAISYKGESTAVRGGKRKVYYQLTPLGMQALPTARDLQEKLWEGIPKMAFTKKD